MFNRLEDTNYDYIKSRSKTEEKPNKLHFKPLSPLDELGTAPLDRGASYTFNFILRAAGGFDEAGSFGFLTGAKPLFAPIFFNNGSIVLDTTGIIIELTGAV